MSDQLTRQAQQVQPKAPPGLSEEDSESDGCEGLKLQDVLLWIRKFEEDIFMGGELCNVSRFENNHPTRGEESMDDLKLLAGFGEVAENVAMVDDVEAGVFKRSIL